MSLDQLARTAAADLWDGTHRGLDPATMLPDLLRARSRRRVGWMAASAAVVVLVLVVVAVGSSWGPRRALVPAKPAPRAESLVVRVGGDLFDAIPSMATPGVRTPHLPSSDEEVAFASLAFSQDGGLVAWSGGPKDAQVRVVDVESGHTLRTVPCGSDSCLAAFTPDRREVVVTDAGRLRRVVIATGAETPVPLPFATQLFSIDISARGRVLLLASRDRAATGPEGLSGVMVTVGLDGSDPAVVGTSSKAFDMSARWSPDGSRIAWLSKAEPSWPSPSQTGVVLHTARADGTGAAEHGSLGTCYCIGGGFPALDWSPQGRLVATLNGVVQELGADGRLRRLTGGWGPIAWRPGR